MKLIVLLDLDYFYAQAEQVRNPEIKNKAVVIVMPTVRGGGAIATCNYKARELKIKSGMPLSLAKKLSNDETIFINADKNYYQELSKKVFDIVDFFCEKVEQVSIDEAYLDLTNPEGIEKAKEICKKIKERIRNDLSLTCSIGLSVNKLIAKMASDENKPDGLTIIEEKDVQSFISNKKVKEVYGLGPKSEKILEKKGISLVKEMQKLSVEELKELFGEAKGKQFHNFSRGIDDREVKENREKKQISRMMTLQKDSLSFEEIVPSLEILCGLVYNQTQKAKQSFKTCSLILITNKFETITKSKTLQSNISLEELKEVEKELLKEFLNSTLQLVRRVGVRVSNFEDSFGIQKKLLEF
jgi:DNA polymerase IV (archaeal DinB-like DNA polymerase)